MKDSAIIGGEALRKAVDRVADQKSEALECLGEREPVLAEFIDRTLTAIAGRMALSGAPSEIVKDCHEHITCVVLISLEASRIAHYELWEEAADGKHLEKISAQNEQVTARVAEQEDDDEECEHPDTDL